MVNDNLAHKEYESFNTELNIQESPIKWCSVSLSDVVSRGKRLEASVFDVEAKKARDTVLRNRFGITTLGGNNGMIEHAYYPGRFKRIYCDRSSGEPFYLPSQMCDVYPKADKWISALTKCDMNELRLKQNTLLLTRSGTIGNISFVSKTLENKVYSDDVIRVTFKDEVDLGYVYTYLKHKIGNKILTTNGYGAVITHLEPEHLASVPIPNAPYDLKKQIHNLILKSYAMRDESNDLIDEATTLLIAELHLPDISDFDVKNYKKNAPVETYSVKLSNLFGRADASYHVPIVDAIIEHMKQYADETTTIGDERISKDVILPGRFKRVYVEEGYGRVFIGGKQLWELDPTNKKYLSLVHHGDRISKQLELHSGMTLITCSGTIGKVALVGKQWENWTANQHIIRIIPANEDVAGYISVFLASDYGHELITRFTYGSVVDEIDDKHVRSISIPILKNKEAQKKINTLALDASEKRYEAYQLEQQALDIMEKKILN